ncbi:MAG: TonB-dependent receptor [Bacteroidota bacterium]|nr:TonB-dependent receptor [Bacteroidota bacterium]
MQIIAKFLLLTFLYFPIAISQSEDFLAHAISLDSLLNIKISAASKYLQKTRDIPASVTVVTSEEIDKFGYQNLSEVLQSIKGFYVSYDRNYNYLGVRGFSRPTDYNNRILLMLNGHSLNENIYGSAYFGNDLGINLKSIERIEIVRGPSSALYGSNAMLAVINIITKKGSAIDGLQVHAEVGSYRNLQAAARYGKEFSNDLDVFVSGTLGDIKGEDQFYPEYDNPESNNGIAHNLDWDKYIGFTSALSYKNFSLFGKIASRKKGIPTGAYDIVFNDPDAYTLDEYQFIELKYENDFATDKSVLLRTYYDNYYYFGTYQYDVIANDESKGSWFGTEAQLRWDLTTSNRLIAGIEYKNNTRAVFKYWNSNTIFFDGNFPSSLTSFYLQNEYQALDNLSFTLGLRLDKYSIFKMFTSPRGAIIYHASTAATFKFLYGEAFRIPNVYEVNYHDPYSQFKRSVNLKSEKIATSELIWEQRMSDETFSTISLYRYDMKNLIDTKIDTTDSFKYFGNADNIRAIGLEFGINTRTKQDLNYYFNYSLQSAKKLETDEKLTNSPEHLIKFGINFPLFEYFYAGTEVQWETERLTVYNTKTDPYLLSNLNIKTKPLFNSLTVSFLVRNLFDADYKHPGGFEHRQAGIIQNGRNFIASLDYKF